MANYKLSSKKNKIIKLKLAMERLQRSLSLSKKQTTSDTDEADVRDDDEAYVLEDSNTVPNDVNEGHFAVIAVDEDGGVARRFVVPLRYLAHPMFLALLERAAEVYGFDHRGALTIPCHPSEIERILCERWEDCRRSRRESRWL